MNVKKKKRSRKRILIPTTNIILQDTKFNFNQNAIKTLKKMMMKLITCILSKKREKIITLIHIYSNFLCEKKPERFKTVKNNGTG